jgi:hypothetical protein
MANNSLRLVQFLQILLFLVRQSLPLNIQRLLNSLHTTESNNRTCNPLIDPCERYLTHLPSLLISKFLHTLDDTLIRFGETLVCFWSRSSGLAELVERTSEMTAEKWCPLQSIISTAPPTILELI